MFMLRNVTKYLFGDTSKEELTQISQGQLYLVRPQSPKGYSELIFKDAAATIRRTGQEFQYQLVVQRAYDEGEEPLDEEEQEDDEPAGLGLVSDKDEKIFLLDEALHFQFQIRESGDKVLAWRDLSGDEGDLYEFVCDPAVSEGDFATFEVVAVKCQFERKFRRPNDTATDAELSLFDFTKQPIPSASPVTAKSAGDGPDSLKSSAKRITGDSGAATSANSGRKQQAMVKQDSTVAPVAAKAPSALETLVEEHAELHLFDFPSGEFVQQAPRVVASVTEVGKWKYWLSISDADREWLAQEVIAEINPVFNFEYLSFIFNHYTTDGSAYSWLLRFKDQATIERFQEGLMRALWEQLNEMKWQKVKEDEREYVLDAFQDITLEDQADDDEEFYEVEEPEPEVQRSEHYDEDEEEDDTEAQPQDGNVNSQLAIGHQHDRSFVVRGSKIGVFKHTPNNALEFSTNISKVETPDGKLFSPSKVMLHAGDRNMVMQKKDNPNSLYRMDLEYGKIVDEWKVHDDIPVIGTAPESKFAQLTDEQTFLGIAQNALYRIDPRLTGNKLVESQLKQYASKNEFSAAATTQQGYIAVASNKGDIRMFDRLGINAKTHIPALGESIIGLDVSADGRWVLATCRTYLLLIDAQQKEGKYEGKLGFERSFGKDSKPQPRRLALSPAHVAQFQHETKAPISFTPARFNANPDATGAAETTIVSATGPFVVTWNLKKIIAGRKDSYTIKRYAEEVMADNFKFGSDKNLIVALPNEVSAIEKQHLKRPTRESIAATPRRSTRSRLSRNEIVNSPY